MALPGWRRAPGTGRRERYINPAGEEVSRRQYENARAQSAGWRNWSDYQRARKSDDYLRWIGRTSGEAGVSPSQLAGPESEFSQNYLTVSMLRQRQAGLIEGEPDWEVAERRLTDPDGPLAQLLVDAGLRPPDADYDVGQTP